MATQEDGQDMHHKFCVMDSHTVMTGSYNWSRKAQRNFENITITDEEPTFASQYLAEFKEIKKLFEKEQRLGIDYQAIRHRVEVIKMLCELQDEEDITHQCAKIQKILPAQLPDRLTIVAGIIQNAKEAKYKEVKELATEYLLKTTVISTIVQETARASGEVSQVRRGNRIKNDQPVTSPETDVPF